MASPLRVLAIASHPFDRTPGQRFRFEQWLRLLPARSIEFELRALFAAGVYERLYRPGHLARKTLDTLWGAARRVTDIARAGRFDVVFLHREAFPLGPPIIEALMSSRVPVVYDFDDAIFIGDTSHANRVVSRLKQPERVEAIIRRAAITTVGNSWLRDYAVNYSPRVEVLPTTIDVDAYTFRVRTNNHDRVTVGWSGSRTTSAHLRTIEPSLRRMLKELPIELLVIGDPDFALPGADRVTVRPWSSETELSDLHRIDIGVMPLPDDDWSKGKCGLKALQYMAAGAVPVVSPVGVNTEIVRHGQNGMIATGAGEWVEAIARLVAEPELRTTLARAARQTVEEGYSGRRWALAFLEVLERAASTRT